MILGMLGVSLVENMLAGKWGVRGGDGVILAGERTNSWPGSLILLYPLTNFEIEKCESEPKFNGVYSTNILPKIKDWAFVMNLDEYDVIGTHRIALYVNEDVTYFDSFRVEHISKENKSSLATEI